MTPQLIADLEAARALIDTPDKWVKGYLYAYGPEKMAAIAFATCFCADGAIDRACYISGHIDQNRTKAAVRSLGFSDAAQLWDWNDAPERTHAEVLAAFDRAIANERSKA